MNNFLSGVSLLVPDYDQAIEFYCQKLGFELVENTEMGQKRWVVVRPSPAAQTHFILAKASSEQQIKTIGKQGGDRVWLFLQTEDFDRDYAAFNKAGVTFLETPRTETYGKVAVFVDAFGNKWDLIQRFN